MSYLVLQEISRMVDSCWFYRKIMKEIAHLIITFCDYMQVVVDEALITANCQQGIINNPITRSTLGNYVFDYQKKLNKSEMYDCIDYRIRNCLVNITNSIQPNRWRNIK
jgi:hypothetical protein